MAQNPEKGLQKQTCFAILALWPLAFCNSLSAATYYLGAGASATDSNNNCTQQATPCRTFAKALPLLRPGDTLLAGGGNYLESIASSNISLVKGTAALPVTVRNVPGQTVWLIPINGSMGINLHQNLQYWTFIGINVDGRNMAGGETSGTSGIAVNWRTGPIGSPQSTSHITFQDLEIRDISNATGPHFSIGAQIFADNVKLINVKINGTHRINGDNEGSHCVYAGGPGDGIEIIGGEYHECGGFGIQFNDSGFAGINGNSGGAIRGAKVYHNGLRSSGSRGGVVLYHNQRNHEVINNLIYDNVGAGILVEGGENHDNELYNNTIVGNASNCIHLGSDASHTAYRTLVKNNICKDNGGGIRLGTHADNSQVINNLMHNSGSLTNLSTGATVSPTPMVTSDPLFMSLANQDFRLTADSPAKNAGVNLGTLVPVDYAGVTRPQETLFDIGAYEFPAGTPPADRTPPGRPKGFHQR